MSNQDLEDQIDQKELAPGVLLIKEYKKVENNPNIPDIVGIFTFKVQLKTMNVVDFEVYLNQSENIELENKEGDELRTKNTIMPFETKIVAKVILKDNWKLKSKFKLTMGIPEKAAQIKYIEKDEKKLKNFIESTESKLKNIPFELMSINDINTELKNLNTKFIDLNFPPCDAGVVDSKYDENLKNFLEYIIHWRRPEEFITNELNENMDADLTLRIFNKDKEPEPNDIRQGLIPCNHLDSALSALAEKYNLIKRLFKTDTYNENGIYQIKLCINGEWTTVVVDDYFPCVPLSSPLVTRSQSNELWILILEKALAKVYESYYNLTCINLTDFFLTLTGCPSFSYNLENLQPEEKKDIFNKIKNFVIEKKYLVVAISKMPDLENNNLDNNNEENEEESGLTVPNFGYTIIDVKTKYKPNLIVLRKVWFDEKRENNVDNYLNNLMNEYPSLMNEYNDNLLFLTFKDFLKEFSSLSVCLTKNWEEVHVRGKFIKLENELQNNDEIFQVMSKWYYSINLEKQTNLIISLFQDEDKFKENDTRKNLLDISLSLLKLELNNNTNKNEIIHIQTYDFSMSPNLQLEFNLPPGQYIIVPRTSGCLFGRSVINEIKTEQKRGGEIYNMETKAFSQIFINTVKDVFKKFDILLNKSLGFREFKQFLECVKTDLNNFDENEFKNILAQYQSYNDMITENGFIEFWKKNLIENELEVKTWLKNLGYDEDLFPLKSRCFMLTFHSDIPISVSARDNLNTDLNKKIDKLVIKTMGIKIKNKKDISVFQYQSKISNIFSYGCLNEGNEPFKVNIIFRSENNIYSAGKNKIEKIVQPNKYEFLTHVFPLPNTDMNNELEFSIEYFPIN